MSGYCDQCGNTICICAEIQPRQWVGLTDEEANDTIEQAGLHYCWDTEGHFDAVTACSLVSQEKERDDSERLKILKPLITAIEAKLREKNAPGWQSVANLTEYLDDLRGGADE